jgi:hypothetical protein
MKDGDIIRNDIDRADLLEVLSDFYGTHDLEQISFFLKRDLKDSTKFNRLFEYIGYDEKEFFYLGAIYFIDIFNKATIKHVKRILSERRKNI